MPDSPFPGMNPYLEHPQLWSEVHNRLIVAIADRLAEILSEVYRIAIETRVYLNEPEAQAFVGIPDVSVLSAKAPADRGGTATLSHPAEPTTVTVPMAEELKERYLEIRDGETGAVITAIEILSPSNKRPGAGRQSYERKRYQILNSLTHLIEIDLLRGGTPLPVEGAPLSDYRILISRSQSRPSAQLYGISLRQPLPTIPIPLRAGETEPLLDLQAILAAVYRRGRYHLAVDYSQPPLPPLPAEDWTWTQTLLGAVDEGRGGVE